MHTCQFCGAEVNALTNHVRLSKGDGHGPGGQYPAGFNDGVDPGGQRTVESEQATATPEERTTTGTAPPQGGSNTEQVESTGQEASASEVGRSTAQQGTDEHSDGPADFCPACGEGHFVPATNYLQRYSDRLSDDDIGALNRGERVCLECGSVWS